MEILGGVSMALLGMFLSLSQWAFHFSMFPPLPSPSLGKKETNQTISRVFTLSLVYSFITGRTSEPEVATKDLRQQVRGSQGSIW